MGVFILNNYVINKNKCVSCMACYSVCPVQAIEILTDEDGFYFPSIKKDKCIKCGRCTSICPINNENNRCKSYTNGSILVRNGRYEIYYDG